MITEKIGRKCKQWMVEELIDLFKENKNIFVTNFVNLSVAEQEELRNKLREENSLFLVIKNSICKRAFNKLNHRELRQFLNGPTGLVLGKDTPIKIAKILVDFSNEYPDFVIEGGLIEEEIYSHHKLEELARLPSKEVLLSRIINSIGFPIINFLRILDIQLNRIVYVLFQIKDKKSNEDTTNGAK